jgi:hypothetical protein
VIPQTAAALLAFLFLVAPGIVFETCVNGGGQLSIRRHFGEISRLALASLCFSVLSLVLLAGVRALAPEIMPDPGRWLREGKHYVQDNYRLVAGSFLAELVVAIALAIAWPWWLGRGKTSEIRRVSALRSPQPTIVAVVWTASCHSRPTISAWSTSSHRGRAAATRAHYPVDPPGASLLLDVRHPQACEIPGAIRSLFGAYSAVRSAPPHTS